MITDFKPCLAIIAEFVKLTTDVETFCLAGLAKNLCVVETKHVINSAEFINWKEHRCAGD